MTSKQNFALCAMQILTALSVGSALTTTIVRADATSPQCDVLPTIEQRNIWNSDGRPSRFTIMTEQHLNSVKGELCQSYSAQGKGRMIVETPARCFGLNTQRPEIEGIIVRDAAGHREIYVLETNQADERASLIRAALGGCSRRPRI